MNVGNEHRELVSPEAGHGVAGADGAAEAVGDLDQQTVAGLVTVAVVDQFESVEIEEQHRERSLGSALRTLERQVHPVVERGPVRQTGEGVVERRLEELLLGPLPHGDVDQHALDTELSVKTDRSGLLKDPGHGARFRDQAVLGLRAHPTVADLESVDGRVHE